MMSIATIAISIDVRLSKRVPWERVWSLVTGLHDPDGDTVGSRADARNLCPRYPYWYVAPIAGTDPANPKPARSGCPAAGAPRSVLFARRSCGARV